MGTSIWASGAEPSGAAAFGALRVAVDVEDPSSTSSLRLSCIVVGAEPLASWPSDDVGRPRFRRRSAASAAASRGVDGVLMFRPSSSFPVVSVDEVTVSEF